NRLHSPPVRSERVQTNLRCNQNCTFCTARRATDEPSWISARAVEQRIRAAIAEGARRIVLTGGEPTLRRDLAGLVARARELGAERVTLETNATLLDPVRACELADAGLDSALVHLSGAGPALDHVTRDPGGADATQRGLDALIAAGVAVDVQAAVVRSTASGLPALAPFLRARFGLGIRTLFLVVPIDSPDPGELLSFDEAGGVVQIGRAHV